MGREGMVKNYNNSKRRRRWNEKKKNVRGKIEIVVVKKRTIEKYIGW